VKRLLALILAVLILGFGALAWYADRPLGLAAPVVEFTLPPGTPMKQVAQRIRSAGVGVFPLALEWLARLTGKDRKVKAGSYEVAAGLTPWTLLLKLTRGDVTQGEIAVIEGWTFRQLRTALAAQTDLEHDSATLSDAEILTRIGATETHPEGLFLPETYLYAKHSSDLHLLQRAYRAMQVQLAEDWAARRPDLPLASPYEALILASIVEKESGRKEDRPLVASVFANRLKAGMRLQTDPAVIYGLGLDFDGNLRKRDLLADTPYNTYLRVGLPPTPIAMPGAEALRLALSPPPSDYLYFVARGDGSSEFSRNLEEHNRAVARYQKRSKD
jgi:peptidoglycan lytic transglycosylase G